MVQSAEYILNVQKAQMCGSVHFLHLFIYSSKNKHKTNRYFMSLKDKIR